MESDVAQILLIQKEIHQLALRQVEEQTRTNIEVGQIKATLADVASAQLACPARRREIARIERRGEWRVYGKLFGWSLGIIGAGVGIAKAIIELWG